ncbi:hypothetical protein B0H16DRAFT_572060 [Mycena metata]|uniref:ARM repeat-containing protein n=1 Tax=Mycena metata TaxID=1033252 RepID=A0AAD7NFT4_9AGAR|nr:hypothetical protein B0H16DRAFT_572060 [Mycena metata]
MLALPPVALSDEHVGDILSALVPLVPHAIPDVRRSVLETIKVVLFCSSSTSLPVVKCGELANIILDLIEHYDHETPVAMAQTTLEILSRIATKSNIPKLLALLRTVHDINALLVTVGVLKNVGSGYNTEEKNELAETHDIFTALTPLLKSLEEVVSTWAGEAVSAFSTAQNIPLFITFLQGDDERLKLMSVRILKELTGGLSEAEKLAVVRSGVLSDLHYLLQKSPGEPSKPEDVVDAGFDDESEPASEPSVPDSTTDGPSPDGSAPSKLDGATTPDKKEREPLADRKEEGRTATASDPVVETNATVIKQPVNNVVPLRKATVDRAIELRDSAFQILDSIATNASDHGMEIIADAYVKTGIHTSLVGLLKEPAHDPTLPGENTRNCIFVLQELARGTDFAKREIIKTDIFREVRRIMDVARGSALRWCCLLVYNLLSSEEVRTAASSTFVGLTCAQVNEDIVLAVLNAEMLERLVANVKKTNDNWRDEWDSDWQPRSAAQALSCLLLSSKDFTWDQLREHDAITCLREFLKSFELVESLFAFRTYMFVEYLEHPQVEAQKFGLLLVNWLLKGGISQRKSVTNTAGMRDALGRCLKSEDAEVRAQAGELIAKLPNQSRRR